MLDRLGNEVDFTELFMEETLTTKDKKELPDSMYGLVYTDEKGNKVRKFPLNDESHVRQAAIFFDRAKDLTEDQKRELARNIVRRAKELDMDYSGWESLKPYLDKPVKESFSTFEQNGFDDLFGYILETYKPYDEYLKLHQYDSKTNTTQQQTTNNTPPPPIQESFNEMFGEKVSLKNMYQESSVDMMKVDDLECDELYFGSDTKYPVEIDLNRPLFVTPLKGIASIFVGRADLKGIIPKGSYNLDYKEWRLPDKELMKPLKTVHVYVEGYPDLKEQEITLKGYIHCIPFKYYKDNIYRYPWMSKGVEYLIANTENMKVEFTRIIECEVKYIVKGVPSDNPKYGPYKNTNEMIEGWRFTHKGEGIYEALKNAMWNITRSPKAWTEFKNSEACSWLPKPPLYGSNDRSYFTRLGYDTFMERTFPIMKKYLNEEDIEVSQTVVSSSDIVYRDQYQFVTDKSKTIQEGLFFNKKEYTAPQISETYQEFVDAYNDQTFKSIISVFKNRKSKLLSNWMNENFPVDGYRSVEDNDGTVVEFLSKDKVDEFTVSDNKYNIIGFGFATVRNPDEWLTICVTDGKVYYCDIRPDSVIANSFNEFLKSFGSTFDQYLKKYLKRAETDTFYKVLKSELGQTVQESATSGQLFKQLPKDLQAYLEKGDFTDIDEDYGIDGFFVDEFDTPESVTLACESYDLKKDDKFYNAIDFATDGSGNDFVYLPTDGFYYCLDHESYDEYDHIHGDKLSSRKWSELIDPNHKTTRQADDEFNKERLMKFRSICESSTYTRLCEVTLSDTVSNALCSLILSDFKKTDFADKVWAFANQYNFDSIDNAMTDLHSFVKDEFAPKLFVRNNYNIDGLKDKCIKFIRSILTTAKEHGIDTSVCNSNTIKRHKLFIEKYGTKPIQEGVMNDIKNGVNPFSDKRIFHVSSQGHLDGQVFNPRVPEYLDKYDPTYPNFEDVSNPRVCFSTSIEGALNAIAVKLSRWKPDRFDKMYVYVPEKPLKEYKHTSNKDLIKDKKVYDANLTKEIWIEEPVRLKLYGVIRVDQVSKSSKKSTVPMLNGKRGDRDYYSFKWHWVVKPQVLKNIPFEYSPEWVCRDMIDDLKGFKYGIPVNGEIKNVSSSDYYDKNYKSLSPEEFEKYKGGICWDYVEWEEGYLKAYGYDCKKYYIFTDTEDSDTHTFITVDDGKGGLIYPESSFSPLEGVHKIKNVEEAIKMIADKMFSVNNNDKKYDEIKYYVWEYSGHPPYGSNTKQCTEYYSKGEPFYEGVAKNKKE